MSRFMSGPNVKRLLVAAKEGDNQLIKLSPQKSATLESACTEVSNLRVDLGASAMKEVISTGVLCDVNETVDVDHLDLRRDLIDLEVESVSVPKQTAALTDYFETERVVGHAEAYEWMARFLSSFDPRIDGKYDYDRVFESVDGLNYLHSEDSKEKAMALFLEAGESKDQKERSEWKKGFEMFRGTKMGKKAPAFDDLVGRAPIFINHEDTVRQLGITSERVTPALAIAYQNLYIKAARELPRNEEGERKLYLLSQIAAEAGDVAGGVVDHYAVTVRKVPSLSMLNLFMRYDGEFNLALARKFIDMRLSVLLPDKDKFSSMKSKERGFEDVAQESFITTDIKAFVEVVGLSEEYDPIFRSLMVYRQIQHIDDFYRPFLKMVEAFPAENGGRRPEVAIMGGGEGFLGRYLYDKKLVSRIVELDMDESTDDFSLEKFSNGDATGRFMVRGARSIDFYDPYEARGFMNASMGGIDVSIPDGADIILAASFLHETDDLSAYLHELKSRVKEGGRLVVVEPVASGHDTLTRQKLFAFDNTKFQESLIPIEEYARLVALLSTDDMDLEKIDVNFPRSAGNNDEYCRVCFVMKKDRESAPFKFNLPRGTFPTLMGRLGSMGEAFNAWPLCLLDRDQRKIIENCMINKADLRSTYKPWTGIYRSQALREVLQRLSGVSKDTLRRERGHLKPLDYVDKFVATNQQKRSLGSYVYRQNKLVAEVLLLERYIKANELGIDIRSIVLANVPEFAEFFPPEDTLEG